MRVLTFTWLSTEIHYIIGFVEFPRILKLRQIATKPFARNTLRFNMEAVAFHCLNCYKMQGSPPVWICPLSLNSHLDIWLGRTCRQATLVLKFIKVAHNSGCCLVIIYTRPHGVESS